ncbi:hypothetical protein BGZ76_011566 [Entomortierella beljakovae]|nr:hypothetical protein BGZ76_011566 [Entomortierella beljakovae]
MEDIQMEASLQKAEVTNDSVTKQEETQMSGQDSKLGAIHSSLGQSIVNDFAIYRDILEEHMIFALHRAEPKEFHPQFSSTSEAISEFKEKHTTVLKLFHRASIDLQGANYYRYQRSISGAMQEYIEAMTLEYYLVHGKLMPKSALEVDFVFMTSPEQLNDLDSIIPIGQTQLGGGGGNSRGKFNKDNKKASYNKDKRDGGKKVDVPIVTDTPSETSTSNAMITADQNQANTDTASTKEALLIRHSLEVTDEDYLLGIADLTGELMRLAINTLGQSLVVSVQDLGLRDEFHIPTPDARVQQILSFLRDIKNGFDNLSLTKTSPITKKMTALKQSLSKIEMACYNVKVRGAEYPPDILKQMLMAGGSFGNVEEAGIGDDDD